MKCVKCLIAFLAIAVIASGAVGVNYLYNVQEERLFNFKTLPEGYKFTSNYPFREVFLETPDKGVIHGLHYTIPGSKGVVLYFHGRGKNLATEGNRVAKDFASRGLDVLVIDYRGFGKSQGAMSFPSLLSDAKMFYNYLLDEYKESEITLYGRSLGTGIATYLAAIRRPARLILEAPYYSIPDVACRMFPLAPKVLIPYVLKYPIRTDLWIQKVKVPVYFFHGTNDKTIPHDASMRLHNLIAHKTRSEITLIQDGSHDSLPYHANYQSTLDHILALP